VFSGWSLLGDIFLKVTEKFKIIATILT